MVFIGMRQIMGIVRTASSPSNFPKFWAPLTHDLHLFKGDDRVWEFDGEDDYVDISDLGTLDLHDSDYTIYVRYKPTDVTGQFLFGEGTNNDYIKFSSTGVITIEDSVDTVFTNDFGDGFNTGEENELFIFFDSGSDEINIRVNGDTRTAVTNNLTATYNSGRIGQSKATEFFTGDYYEVQIYDKVLDSTDIADVEAGGTASSNLLTRWDPTSAKLGNEKVYDLSGNGNHGTSFGKGEFTRTTTGTVKDNNDNIVTCGIDVNRHEGARFINDSKGFSDNIGENAIEFDDSEPNYIDIPYSNLNTAASISMWIKGISDQNTNWSSFRSSSDTIGFLDNGSSSLNFRMRDSGGSFHSTGGSTILFNDNKWHYIIGTVTLNGNIKLYIDGKLDASGSAGASFNNSDSFFYIGQEGAAGREFNGYIDNVKIFDTALTGEEVMQEFLQQSKETNITADDNLVGWWKLDDTDSSITDYSGNENDGTFNSGGSPATPTNVEGVYDSGAKISQSTLKGILIEEQRTNLFLNSDAPATQSITVVNATEYTLSVKGSGSIALSGGGSGTATEGSDVTFTTSSTSITCTVSGSLDYTQVEQGSFATSFIITAGTSVTRTKDVSSYDVSDTITQGQGSLYIETEPIGIPVGANNFLFSLYNDSNNKFQIFHNPSNQFRLTFDTSGSTVVDIRASSITINQKHKVLITYKDDNVKYYVDGVKIGQDTSCTIPVGLSTLNIGSDMSSSSTYNGTIKNVKYSKNVISESEAKRLTSL